MDPITVTFIIMYISSYIDFTRKWTLTVDSLNWIAIGIANKQQLEDRNFSGLNGRSRHGCYVMDCWGWVHTA